MKLFLVLLASLASSTLAIFAPPSPLGLVLNAETQTPVPEDVSDTTTYRVVYDALADLSENPDFANALKDKLKLSGNGNENENDRRALAARDAKATCDAVCASPASLGVLCPIIQVPILVNTCQAVTGGLNSDAGRAACRNWCGAAWNVIGGIVNNPGHSTSIGVGGQNITFGAGRPPRPVQPVQPIQPIQPIQPSQQQPPQQQPPQQQPPQQQPPQQQPPQQGQQVQQSQQNQQGQQQQGQQQQRPQQQGAQQQQQQPPQQNGQRQGQQGRVAVPVGANGQ